MKTFKTTDGTEWQVVVNVGTIKRVQDDTGLRLTDLFASAEKIGAFFADDVKFCEVLFSTIRPQAEAAGKTLDDFLAGIDGTVIEGAVEALLAEVADFFQEPRKGLLKKMLVKYQAAHEKLTTEGVLAAEKKIEETDFETLLRQTLTSSASSSPASAA
jgi:hypothetical protein